MFPKAFELVINRDTLVRDYWYMSRWKLATKRGITAVDMMQLAIIRKLLLGAPINQQEENQKIWRWGTGGRFSVKSIYRLLIEGGIRFKEAKFIWKTVCPSKVSIFMADS